MFDNVSIGQPRCLVCTHPQRISIENALLDPRNSLSSLAKKHGFHRHTLATHRSKHFADKASKAIEIHRGISEAIEVAGASTEVAKLYAKAHKLGLLAEEQGDIRTALLAVRELTRLVELQSRLMLEARSGLAKDVKNHPVWHELCGSIVTALASHPEARADVMAIVAERLGLPAGEGGYPSTPSP